MNSRKLPVIWHAPLRRIVRGGDPSAIVQACVQFAIAEQGERTKRLQIIANRDRDVQAIEAERKLMETYFKQRFAERKTCLRRFLDVLALSVEKKDDAGLQIAMEGILGILKDSPLKDIESFRQARERGEAFEI